MTISDRADKAVQLKMFGGYNCSKFTITHFNFNITGDYIQEKGHERDNIGRGK